MKLNTFADMPNELKWTISRIYPLSVEQLHATPREQGCQITAFLRPNLQQCSLFFFVLGFCFLCLLDYTNDDLASKMQ